MHLRNSIITLPFLYGLSAATCWGDGGYLADTALGQKSLWGVASWMQGYFQDGQVKQACIDDYDAGTHWYVTVTKKNGAGTIEAKAISNGIGKEMGGCKRGGHSWDGDWEFNADVLHGVCVDKDFFNNHPNLVTEIPKGS